jgi:hypothetical protein
MPNPLFSRYSQGENRVTASILAVFERISFALLERILQIICEEPNESLLEIKNQIKPKGSNAIPDGAIQASFAYWIETKVVPGTVDKDQLQRHLQALEQHPNASKKKLIVLSPDALQPQVVTDLADKHVVWTNFNTLTNAISEVLSLNENWLTNNFSLASEQEKVLLRELVQMFLSEGLLGSDRSDSVLIIPARYAIYDYLKYSAYLCQPNRSFQNVEYLGFYHGGAIDRRITKLLAPPIESVLLTEEGVQNLIDINDQNKNNKGNKIISEESITMLQNLVTKLEPLRYNDTMKVFFLSSPDAPETIQLKQDIQNDLKSYSGRPSAFTMGQRYVSLASLKKNPKTTTELLDNG